MGGGSSPRPPRRGGSGKGPRQPRPGRSKSPPPRNNGKKGRSNSRDTGGGSSSFPFKPLVLTGVLAAAAKFTNNLGSGGGKNEDKTATGTPGDHDLFLFAHSWAPSFCCSSAKKCKSEGMAQTTDLSPHGLWPAYLAARSGKTYPQFCQPAGAGGGGRSREGHEWSKHGTCTLLTRFQYFAEEMVVHESDPIIDARELLIDHAGAPVSTVELVSALGGEKKVAIMTDKSCRLSEITTCWGKNPDGTVGAQADCPKHVLGSNRNSAVKKGCVQLFLDAAGQCAKITDEMLHVLKRA